MTAWPAIAELGIVPGRGTAALMDSEGTVVWWCPDRIDGPSVFASLLDPTAGSWRLRVSGSDAARPTYRPDTLVPETTWFAGEHAVARAVDWFTDGDALVRRVTALQPCRVTATVSLRPDYGRAGDVPVVTARSAAMGSLTLSWTDNAVVSVDGTDLFVDADLAAGEALTTVLGRSAVDAAATAPDDVTAQWRSWTDDLRAAGTTDEDVLASARILRGLVHHPTGAAVAAATTSLPEGVGGERNWDYRLCWLRDTAWMMGALVAAGSLGEPAGYLAWFADLVARHGTHLQPVYRVDGSAEMTEVELVHLRGYADSRPVRAGNGAAGQLQLDSYASAIDLQWDLLQAGGPLVLGWDLVVAVVDQIVADWELPDAGLWEVRSAPRHHTFSKFQCWLGIDRARRIGLATGMSVPERWEAEAERIREVTLRHGTAADVPALTQSFGSDRMDAALLLAPLKGFVDVDGPVATATIQRVRNELDLGGGMLLRYRTEDGLSGGEGVFLMCSFWLATLLARRGEVDEASAIVERILATRGPFGLLSEEIEPTTSAQLGNTPQGFSHLGLIHALLAIEAARGRRGRPG